MQLQASSAVAVASNSGGFYESMTLECKSLYRGTDTWRYLSWQAGSEKGHRSGLNMVQLLYTCDFFNIRRVSYYDKILPRVRVVEIVYLVHSMILYDPLAVHGMIFIVKPFESLASYSLTLTLILHFFFFVLLPTSPSPLTSVLISS